MAQIRIFVETAGEGYLLPVGAELQAEEVNFLRQSPSGSLYSTNTPVTVTIRGLAGNPDPARTNAGLLQAMTDLVAFFTGNPEIKKILVIEADGSSPLGARLGSAPGTTIKEYLPAHGTPETAGIRWEVLTCSTEDILPPYSYGFVVQLQNWPIGDIDRKSIGGLRTLETTSNREVLNGVETHSIGLSARLDQSQVASMMVSIIEALAFGGVVDMGTATGALPIPADANLPTLVIPGVPQDAVVRELSFSFDRVMSQFTATIHAMRPTRRENGLDNLLSLTVETNIESRTGFKMLDAKFLGRKGFVQRTMNPQATLTVVAMMVCHKDVRPQDADTVLAELASRIENVLLSPNSLIPISGDISQKSGTIGALNEETGNTVGVAFSAEINDPEMLDPDLKTPLSQRQGVAAAGWKLSQFANILGAATLTGLLIGGGPDQLNTDFA